jgi:spore maturation protein SpmA
MYEWVTVRLKVTILGCVSGNKMAEVKGMVFHFFSALEVTYSLLIAYALWVCVRFLRVTMATDVGL